MNRGRVAFWGVSAALIVGIGGYVAWLQYYSGLDSSAPPAPINGAAELKKTMDVPPAAWSPSNPWFKTATLDAYEKANAGKEWPSGRRAVVAYAKSISDAFDRTDDERADAREATEVAKSFDCDDPLIDYIYGWSRRDMPARNKREYIEPMVRAGTTMRTDTRYPPAIRAFIVYRAALYISREVPAVTKVNRSEVPAYIESAQAMFPEIAADRDTPITALITILAGIDDLVDVIKVDRKNLIEPLLAALEKEKWPETVVQTLRGIYYTDYAWDARGSGWASTVTEAGWRGFRERLDAARTALTAAWEADNQNSVAAERMITVCMGQSTERAEMERWFTRAMAANPGNEEACMRKMHFLQPRWGGSVISMIMFGRQLSQVGDDPKAQRLPLMLAKTHWDLAKEAGNGKPDPRYFADNPDLWDDLSRVYEGFLKKSPDSRYHRTSYAVAAAWAGKWDVAAEQFKVLGDDYSREIVSDQILSVMRSRAKQAAAEKPATKPV